jgi:hypothetical protein
MITANPTTNTPLDNWPASGKDAQGPDDAGAQGRAESTLTPETTRKHIALFSMATEGFRPLPEDEQDFAFCTLLHATIDMVCQHGVEVMRRVRVEGAGGVRSIRDARSLRVLLGRLHGKLDGIEHDTRASEQGYSLMDIAEIRLGIRDRNGSLRREWM